MNKYILDNLKKLNNNFLESGQHQATYCTLETSMVTIVKNVLNIMNYEEYKYLILFNRNKIYNAQMQSVKILLLQNTFPRSHYIISPFCKQNVDFKGLLKVSNKISNQFLFYVLLSEMWCPVKIQQADIE
jgi:hypothetical protein